MSDEEKKAVEFVKSELYDEKEARNDYQSLTGLYGNLEIETILNLIENQSKEIEELKQEKEYLNCIIESDKDNYINKDKIKAEIEELDNQKRQWIEDRNNKHKDSELIYAIEVLQSLLQEEENNEC